MVETGPVVEAKDPTLCSYPPCGEVKVEGQLTCQIHKDAADYVVWLLGSIRIGGLSLIQLLLVIAQSDLLKDEVLARQRGRIVVPKVSFKK